MIHFSKNNLLTLALIITLSLPQSHAMKRKYSNSSNSDTSQDYDNNNQNDIIQSDEDSFDDDNNDNDNFNLQSKSDNSGSDDDNINNQLTDDNNINTESRDNNDKDDIFQSDEDFLDDDNNNNSDINNNDNPNNELPNQENELSSNYHNNNTNHSFSDSEGHEQVQKNNNKSNYDIPSFSFINNNKDDDFLDDDNNNTESRYNKSESDVNNKQRKDNLGPGIPYNNKDNYNLFDYNDDNHSLDNEPYIHNELPDDDYSKNDITDYDRNINFSYPPSTQIGINQSLNNKYIQPTFDHMHTELNQSLINIPPINQYSDNYASKDFYRQFHPQPKPPYDNQNINYSIDYERLAVSNENNDYHYYQRDKKIFTLTSTDDIIKPNKQHSHLKTSSLSSSHSSSDIDLEDFTSSNHQGFIDLENKIYSNNPLHNNNLNSHTATIHRSFANKASILLILFVSMASILRQKKKYIANQKNKGQLIITCTA